MKRVLVFLLLLCSVCTVYGQSSQVRSVSSLPATCNPGGGAGGAPADHVDLWNGTTNVPYFCAAVNSWSQVGTGGSVPAGVSTGSSLVSNGVSQPPVYQTKEIADSADSAIVADGSTDTCTTFQAWINAHPGQHLLVRKVAGATIGGDSYSTIDYYSSCTLHLQYNGTILEGVVPDDWQGSPVILFAAGVTGLQIDPSCMGCAIVNIEEVGGGKPAYNAAACYNSGNALVYPFTGAADGILVYGGEPRVEHSQANCNSRDGIQINGTNVNINGYVGQPDDWKVLVGFGDANQHNNLSIFGGDTNAGIEQGFMAYGAGGWGVQDDSTSASSHTGTQTTGNGRDASIAAKATSSISSVSCNTTTFVCSVTASSAVASIQNGIWIVIAGTTNHNGVFYVNSYTSTTQFGFTWVGAPSGTESTGTVGVDGSTHMFANAIRTVSDASCTSGQASLTSQSAQFGRDTQPGANIWIAGAGSSGVVLPTTISTVVNEYSITLATNCLTTVTAAQMSFGGGISHGPIMSHGNSTWISPYWESNQPGAKMASQAVIMGGNMSLNYTSLSNIPAWLTSNAGGAAVLDTNTLEVVDPFDSVGGFQAQCGATTGQVCGLFLRNYNLTAGWSLEMLGSTSGEFWIQDLSAGGTIPFSTIHGGDTTLQSAVNIDIDPSTGDVNFFGTGALLPKVKNGGGFYQGSTSVPAFTIDTSGSHAEDIYTTGANCIAIGGSASLTALPSSFMAQFCEATGISTPLQFTSTLATGTPPFSVTSTTPVANLTVQNCSACIVTETGLLLSTTAPTISSGFGTGASIATNNGTAAFTINVGTGGTASSGVIGLPPATNGWVVHCDDLTNPTAGGGYVIKQTASSASSATIAGYNASFVATAWTASDVLQCIAFGR